jgi:hypothetical protein
MDLRPDGFELLVSDLVDWAIIQRVCSQRAGADDLLPGKRGAVKESAIFER